MNNGYSVSILTGAIIGNTVSTVKLVLKLCEMKRWTSTVLVLSFLTLVLLSCVAVLLIVGEHAEIDDEDVPLHPIASSSYPNSSTKSSRRSIVSHHDHSELEPNDKHSQHHHRHHQNEFVHHDQHHPQMQEPRHNYRKRFTDAIKGVFSDLINSSPNSSSSSSTLSSPIFEEHLPLHPSSSNRNNNGKHDDTAAVESSENNSSRLKRQLDFGSGASSEDYSSNPESKETFRTTQPSAKKYTPPSRRPFVRVIKLGGVSTPRSTVAPSSSSSSSPQSSSSPPSSRSLSSSEEIANSSEEPRERGVGKYRKAIRRFRANKANKQPKLQSLSSREKYDVSQEEQDSPQEPRKNFTLEVVQVERKVVRKEDGNIPPLFKKGKYNIEPRLLKVSKQEDANRPQVVYKKSPHTAASPPVRRVYNRPGKNSASTEISKESTSIEASLEKSEDEGKQPVVVNLNQQIPINDHDLSAEDLKDYHDGHSTFGSKGNFTHTIISRNVAGFVPNSKEDINRNRKSDRKIVIEKGKVTERYPGDHLDNPPVNPEIYSVPGGRSSSTENYSPKQESFPFTRTRQLKGSNSKETEDNDRTSPAISTTLEELYKKGHPGVVPAPKDTVHRKHPFSDPYGESAVYTSPFRHNPLIDDVPLKFDPESDRFYGEPVPDNKERVAQSNSPEHVVNRNGELDSQSDEFFRPAKRDSSSEEEKRPNAGGEEDSRNSKERNDPINRFNFGRAYNPPDYATEYDTEPAGDGENNRSVGDVDNFDFAGLEDNFGPSHHDEGKVEVDNDFFDFPENIGGIGGGRGGETRFGPKARSEEVRDDDGPHRDRSKEDDREDEKNNSDFDERRPPPPPPPRRNSDVDYESNDGFGFGPAPRKDAIEDDDGHPGDFYNNGFIQTLKQFDEEIKKLQDEERHKLLKSTALPTQESSTEHNAASPPISTTTGYKKDPPLIITSPGPLEPPHHAPPAEEFSTTIRASDDDDERDDVTEGNPFISKEHTESGEEAGDTTVPNRSVGAEEDDEETTSTTHRGFGPNDYSTERSGEVDEK